MNKTLLRPISLAIALVCIASGCATAPSVEAGPRVTRALSPVEIAGLRNSLSQGLKDPDSSQFKWMPLVVLDKNTLGYCGLINGKNSYGGYVGYRKFFANISRNANGEYDHGVIIHMASEGSGFSDAIENGTVDGSCRGWGYVDFSEAISQPPK